MKIRIFVFFKYLKESPGSGFIILFMILLIMCVFVLAWESENTAKILANWAYLFLIVGVVMKLIELERFR